MLQRLLVDTQCFQALPYSIYAVDACKNQPVIGADMIERSVERFVRAGLAYLDKGNFKDLCAENAQTGRKSAGLMRRAPNQDTKPG
jgi:hypothetical protein